MQVISRMRLLESLDELRLLGRCESPLGRSQDSRRGLLDEGMRIRPQARNRSALQESFAVGREALEPTGRRYGPTSATQ